MPPDKSLRVFHSLLGKMAALPVFREIMLKIYQEGLVGPAPRFPEEMEENIDAYLRG
jgi:hypothetical protein